MRFFLATLSLPLSLSLKFVTSGSGSRLSAYGLQPSHHSFPALVSQSSPSSSSSIVHLLVSIKTKRVADVRRNIAERHIDKMPPTTSKSSISGGSASDEPLDD